MKKSRGLGRGQGSQLMKPHHPQAKPARATVAHNRWHAHKPGAHRGLAVGLAIATPVLVIAIAILAVLMVAHGADSRSAVTSSRSVRSSRSARVSQSATSAVVRGKAVTWQQVWRISAAKNQGITLSAAKRLLGKPDQVDDLRQQDGTKTPTLWWNHLQVSGYANVTLDIVFRHNRAVIVSGGTTRAGFVAADKLAAVTKGMSVTQVVRDLGLPAGFNRMAETGGESVSMMYELKAKTHVYLSSVAGKVTAVERK